MIILVRLRGFDAGEALKRSVPVKLRRASGTSPRIAAIGATDAPSFTETLAARESVFAIVRLWRWNECVAVLDGHLETPSSAKQRVEVRCGGLLYAFHIFIVADYTEDVKRKDVVI